MIFFVIEFLYYAKCWSPKEKMSGVDNCVEKHVIQLEYISTNVDIDYQLPAICCTFHQRVQCIKSELSEFCDEDNVRYATQMVDDTTNDLTAFMCYRFSTVRDCDRHLRRDVWQAIKEVADTQDRDLLQRIHSHRSALAPIVAIVSEFPL